MRDVSEFSKLSDHTRAPGAWLPFESLCLSVLSAHLVGTTVLSAPAHGRMWVEVEPPSLETDSSMSTPPSPTSDSGTGSSPAPQQ